MIINGRELLHRAPIKHMQDHKIPVHGVTYGLGEAGYDIRIKQEVKFDFRYGKYGRERCLTVRDEFGQIQLMADGRFVLASAIEEFQMPRDLVGTVHDKSSWARRGLSVFNTVIEPGWHGFLTLELVYHGEGELIIPAGAPIAQVVFKLAVEEAQYTGRYQNQPNEPVPAKDAT